MERIDIEIMPVSGDFVLPKYGSEEASGMDLHASLSEDRVIAGGKWALVPTGFAMSMPPGYEAQIRPRSGLAANHGLTVLNSPGTIDSDYRGEVKVILINLGDEDYILKPGTRIAQMVIHKVYRGDIREVKELKSTVRGDGGFGSTGI